MTTVGGTINNGIEFGIAYASPLTVTSTGYINAGNNGYHGAAVYGGAGPPLYQTNQGRTPIPQLGGPGIEDANNQGFSINNSGTITANGDGIYFTHQGPLTNSGTIISAANDGIGSRNAGLQVTNASTGLISGYSNGLYLAGATITNSGTIKQTSVFGNGIGFKHGSTASVSNSG